VFSYYLQKKVTADEIARRMTTAGHKISSLHGSKEVGERDTTIDDFREGRSKVLITTNVIARGIDIAQVNLVINYDIPLNAEHKPDAETYLHRIGRTGRFGRKGVSINFVHDKRSWDQMHVIEEVLGRKIERIDTSDADEMEKVYNSNLICTGLTTLSDSTTSTEGKRSYDWVRRQFYAPILSILLCGGLLFFICRFRISCIILKSKYHVVSCT